MRKAASMKHMKKRNTKTRSSNACRNRRASRTLMCSTWMLKWKTWGSAKVLIKPEMTW